MKRLPALAAVLAAALVGLTACGKKPSAPTVPDSQPAPVAKAPPGANANPGPNPNAPADPSLPNPPPQRPLFALTVNVATIRTANLENLKQLGTAFVNAGDTFGGIPTGVADKSGKVGLSWRVAILPFIEQEALYNAFHLDEPWDSEHNKTLIAKMPKMFAPANTNTFGYTFYRSFTGKDTVMPPPAQALTAKQVVVGARLNTITDGTVNTLLVAEAYDPVIWTKPDELPFTPGKPPKLGGGVFANGFCALLADGSARFLPMNMPAADLSNLIQINDGNVVTLP